MKAAPLLVALAGCTGDRAPEPLPLDMHASFGATVIAEDMLLVHDDEVGDIVVAEVRFTTDAQRVEFLVTGRKRGAESALPAIIEETTTFSPTAVCALRPVGNVLFIAGWNEGTATAILEEWTLDGWALATTHDEKGKEHTLFTPPDISRRRLFERGDVRPVVDIECAPFSGERGHLWLMEYDGDRRILAHDIATSSLFSSPVDSGASFEPLTGRYSMEGFLHETDGFVMFCRSYPPWSSPVGNQPSVTFIDADLDGTFEERRALITERDITTRFTHDRWVIEY